MKYKSILFFLLFVISLAQVTAQAPVGMNYQAIVRNADGNPVANNTPVTFRFTIHDGSPNGASVFTEMDSVKANQFGLITTIIGSVSNLGTVNWGSGPQFMQVETDINNTGNFTDMGTSQLLSVPYALYAANSPAGPTGPAGINGTNGLTGATGPAGANGLNGVTGPIGLAGANGLQGAMGPRGATGATGKNGNDGAAGATGPAGANGLDGAVGPTGPAGTPGKNGNNGATGATGPAGANGVKGANGPTGNNGVPGATGPAGANGLNGAPGPMGPTGAAGINGNDGAVGATGPAGANGLDGAPGPMGPTGAAGINGNDGAVGATGPAGANGLDGAPGPMGPTGAAGINGNDGAVGATGPAGANGLDGAPGPIGPTGAAGINGNDGAVGATGPAGTNGLDGAQGPIGPTGAAGVNGNDGAVGATGPVGLAGATGAGSLTASSSAVSIDTGSQTFAVQAGLPYLSGDRIRMLNSPSAYMTGNVTSYGGVTLVVYVDTAVGSGSFSNWSIAPVGNAGPQGPAGLLPSGSIAGNTPYWNGSTWVVNNSNFYSTGTKVGINTASPAAVLSVGASSQFQVDTNGNMLKVNDVGYSWPTKQGNPQAVMFNDGAGNLTWGDSVNVSGGSITGHVRTSASLATVTLDYSDFFVVVTGNSNTTVNLPVPAANLVGRMLIIRNATSPQKAVTFTTVSGTYMVAQGQSAPATSITNNSDNVGEQNIRFITDGNLWYAW